MIKNIRYTPLLCALALLVTSCGVTDNNSTFWGNNNNFSHRLERGENAELLQTIKSQLLTQYGEVGSASATIYHTASVATPTADSTSAESASASSTNVQESGVDEADRLKNDGQYVYAASVDKPAIMVFSADAQATKLAELTLSSEQNFSPLKGFYLQNQQITALSSPHHFGIYPVPLAADIAYLNPGSSSTEVFTLDVTNPTQPQQTRKLSLDGELVSSRMIGSRLYLATRHAVNLGGLVYPADSAKASANRSRINVAQLADFLPKYAINGVEQGALFNGSDCFKTAYHKDSHALSIISVLTLDTADAAARPQGQCFLGDIETLYASTSALYLATTSYTYATEDGRAIYSGTVNTDLHRFALANDTVNYSGSGRVSGHLGWHQDLKPFRLSEHEDTLRVITYTGDAVSTDESAVSPAHLYNLQANTTTGELEVIGELPNTQRPAALGKPGEQIYATRFAGDRGYLVTYRLTDPLYILDLTNPHDPYIASELEISGYSDYLHPVGENLLLGIGKEAVVTEANTTAVDESTGSGIAATEPVEVARGAWYQGVKLSLFDVSNPQLPSELQTIELGKRGSNTPVSQSHRAFTSLQQGNTLRITVPLSRHETVRGNNSYYNPEMPQYHYDWTQDELLRFEIDTNNSVMTQLPSVIAARASDQEGYAYSQHWSADRSALIGERVYYLQGDQLHTTIW